MTTNILQAVRDRNLFGAWFKSRSSWSAWFTFLAALFALPMTAEQLAIFRECTGREYAPTAPAREAWLPVGRRGGKSFILALVAVFVACFLDHRPYLAPGERGTIMVIARDRLQARIILRYIGALLRVPLLKQMIERETATSFDLDNSVTIEVHTASFKSTRGYAIIAALCDEAAYWPTEDSADPDFEIINALKPGMAQFPHALLLCASSPYARRGALWEAYRQHYGKTDSPVLVWQASTRRMNPTIPQSVVDEAMDRDPAWAAAEYLAQFRSDVESFVNRDAVVACVTPGIYERLPVPGLQYAAFTDPSGGAADSFTLAIAHRDADSLILDCVREVRPPFSPESVCTEFADTLKSYGVKRVTGDRYGGQWPREQFLKYGITYELSARPKSDIYRDVLPLINSRRVELLDNNKLISQFTILERKTARGGRDSIDHPAGSHDDLANAVAGVVTSLGVTKQKIRLGVFGYGGPVTEIDPRTGRPINLEPARIKWVKVHEANVPAARGFH